MIKKLTGRFPLRKLAAAGWLAVMLSVLLPAMGRAQSNPDVLNTTYPDTVAAGSGAFTLEIDGNYTRTPAAFCFYTGYGASATPLATTYGYFPYYYGINVPAATIQQIPPSAFSGGVFNAKVYPVASATASCTGTPNVNYTNSLNVAVTLPTVTFVSATALPRHNTNLSGVAPPTELVVAGTGFGPGATATISGAGFTTFTATTTVTSDSAIRVDTPLVPASATSLNIQICVPSTTYTYCTATKSLNILELAANNGTLTTSGTASNLTLSSTFGAAAGNTAGLPVGSVTFKDGASTLGVAAQTLATQVFAAATTAGTWSTSGGGTLKAFQADFDKDGLPDTLVYDSATGISTLHLLLGSNNRGDTANDFPVSLGYSLSCSNYDGLAVGDFNNDGYPDIALLCDYESTYNGVVYMLMNNGDATFTSNTIFLSQPANAIAAADFNKDGKLDLVLVGKTAAGANNFLTMFGDGTGHFSSTKSSPATSAVATLILAADLNNDGYPDIALANSANGTVTAWQNDKTGGFPTSPNYSRFGYGNNISNLLVTYSTASTYPNLITITPNTETLVYNNRVAALGFSDTGYPITIPGLVTATSGDFNQDGNADLLVSTGSAIQVFYGYSYGQIATTPAYSINAAVSTFAGAGDFNSDGFPDAAAVGYGANSGFARTYVTSGTLTASLPGQSFLTAGYHTLTATNPGTVAWAPGTATNSYFVNPTAAIALTVSPASPATYSPTGTEALTATLTTNSTGYASGTVTFKDGTTTLGTATLAQSGPANTSVATLNFALAAGSHSLTATYNPPPESFPAMTSAAMSYTVNKGTPVVAWTPNPATIAYGTPLTAAQLNATATLGGSTVPGTFVYNPPAGTYLPVGANTVTATFTPTDQANYNTPATASTTINVTPATFAAPTTAVTQTSATQTAYVTIRTAGTPGAINVLAQGAAARDFNLASGSTCSTGTAYTVNQVCAVNYTFSPKAPGLRLGAITLTSGTTLLGTTYISGEGTGPLAVISPGTITAVAGTGAAGYVAAQDNNTTAATSTPLNAPANEAVDGAGNLYISDSANHRIRKVAAATGFISTVAGNGTNAYTASQDTGTTLATSASITVPLGITVDGAGNLYFVDRDSFRVRKVTAATGFISTVAGNGTTGTGAPQDPGNVLATSVGVVPTDVTVDAAGNLYIADQQVHRVRKVTAATGFISTIAGNGTAGYNATQDTGTTAATATSLNGPAAVALDKSGNVYIADSNNNRVRKVSASTGFISTVAGNGTTTYNAAQDTGATAATGSSISNPQGVAVDAAGNLFVSDYGHARQRKVEAATGFISTVAVSGTAGPIGSGEGIALDGAGNLFVADVNANIVRRVAATVPAILTFPTTTAFASSTPQNATLSNNGDTTPLTLTALAIDSTSFSLAGSTCTATGTVAAGNKCVLSVTFTPQMAGALTGTAKATDNSLNVAGSMQAVPLAGTGALATKTITFNQPTTPAPLNSSDTLSATASNGDAVVFSVLAGSADISGNTITYTSPGTVTIAADSPANGAYAAATRVTRDVQVTQNSTYTSVYSYDNPATVGDSVTLVATVNASNEGTPTGSVSFYDGDQPDPTPTDLYLRTGVHRYKQPFGRNAPDHRRLQRRWDVPGQHLRGIGAGDQQAPGGGDLGAAGEYCGRNAAHLQAAERDCHRRKPWR